MLHPKLFVASLILSPLFDFLKIFAIERIENQPNPRDFLERLSILRYLISEGCNNIGKHFQFCEILSLLLISKDK